MGQFKPGQIVQLKPDTQVGFYLSWVYTIHSMVVLSNGLLKVHKMKPGYSINDVPRREFGLLNSDLRLVSSVLKSRRKWQNLK